MDDTTPDKIKDLLETAIKNHTTAFAAQSRYFDSIVKRNMASFASLSDARIESLQKINESQTFNEAFEANFAYEDAVRRELEKLHEDHRQSWVELQEILQSVYVPADNDEEAAFSL